MNRKPSFFRTLLSLLLAVVILSPLAFAVEANTAGKPQELVMNYSGLFPGSIKSEGYRLTLCSLPEDASFGYLGMKLATEAGQGVCQEFTARQADNSASFSLPETLEGVYYLTFFRSEEQYATYHSFLMNLPVLVEQGVVTPIESPALAPNLRYASQESSSREALAYYLSPTQDIESDHEEILLTARQITQGIEGAYQKALAIHDWVCDNIYYDFDAFYEITPIESYTALSTLHTRKGVCQNYANLTAALLRAVGIPAKVVNGYALGLTTDGKTFPAEQFAGTGTSNHAWNEAFLEGRWVIIDATWDSKNALEPGSSLSGSRCYHYFDISQQLFAQDHLVTQEEPFPKHYREIHLTVGSPFYETEAGWKQISPEGVAPILLNGRTLLPIKAIIEEMGGSVEWQPATEDAPAQVICRLNGRTARMWMDSRRLLIDQEEHEFDVPPQVIKGRTLVPVGILLQSLGCEVQWDAANQRITIGFNS